MELERVTRELSLQLNRIALEKLTIKPSQPILLIEGIDLDEVKNWIESRRSQEFGRFSVKDDEDRQEVAEWFVEKIREFYNYSATQHHNRGI